MMLFVTTLSIEPEPRIATPTPRFAEIRLEDAGPPSPIWLPRAL